MFASLGKAMGILTDGALFGVVMKSLLLTLGLFVGAYLGANYALSFLPTLGWEWVNAILHAIAPALFLLLLVLLGAPVAAVFVGLFVDEIADAVEARHYPDDPPSKGVPFFVGLFAGLRLAGLVILATLVMLPLQLLLPGIGTLAALAVTGYLLGREFFELVALRHHTPTQARALRRARRGTIMAAGAIIAVIAAIPLVNLIAPLLATAFMVHLYKTFEREKRA